MEGGSYWIYEVNEEQYRPVGPPVIRTYQWRERVSSAVTDHPRRRSFRVERFTRLAENQPWTLDSVFRVRVLDDELLRSAGNLDYVRLIFPVVESARWNGNAYNSLGPDLYQYRSIGRPFRLLNQTFPETATVVQQNDSTGVSLNRRIEVYARQIGLVYREESNLSYCTASPACRGQIEYGYRRYVRLRTHGGP